MGEFILGWFTVYLVLGAISLFCTATAIVQARRIYWLVPVYFMLAWLAGELALIHIAWQVVLTLLVALFGGFANQQAQWGLALFAAAWLGLLYLHVQAMDSPRHLWAALQRALGHGYRSAVPEERQWTLESDVFSRHWLRPFSFPRDGVRVHEHLAYGEAGKRNELDIYQPVEPRQGGFPILLQIHGGGWMIGEKEQQAKPLMYHMAQRGWICVAINYRLSPQEAFPAHIIDVKKAIAWIRDNIREYGGNPDFIAVTGGSAGGHLSALAALTPNRAEWQPGFEEADTSLQAAVPFYGVYDFLDRDGIRGGMSMHDFLEERVLQCDRETNPELWDNSSPLSHVGSDAPPMFMLHGTHDSLVWVEEARAFVAALQEVATRPVAYAELPGGQHAFEVFHSVRTDHAVNAVADFLEWCHADWLAGQS